MLRLAVIRPPRRTTRGVIVTSARSGWASHVPQLMRERIAKRPLANVRLPGVELLVELLTLLAPAAADPLECQEPCSRGNEGV